MVEAKNLETKTATDDGTPPQATRWAGQTYKSGTQERHRTVEGATFTSQNDGGGGISDRGQHALDWGQQRHLNPPRKGPRTPKRRCRNSQLGDELANRSCEGRYMNMWTHRHERRGGDRRNHWRDREERPHHRNLRGKVLGTNTT